MFNLSENLGQGVTKSYNADESIILFRFTDSNRETVDIYINSALAVLQAWEQSEILYMIQDISGEGVVLTPYLRERLKELGATIKKRNLKVRNALIMEDNFTGQLMRTFGRLFNLNTPNLKQTFFTDMDQALTWIKEHQANDSEA